MIFGAALVTGSLLLSVISAKVNLLALMKIEPLESVTGRVNVSHCTLFALVAALLVGVRCPCEQGFSISSLSMIIFAVWSTIIAYFDRQTTWVTDLSIFVVVAGSVSVGYHDPWIARIASIRVPYLSDALLHVLAVLSLSFAIIAFSWFVHWVQARRGRIFFSGADVVAVLLPVLVFGVSYASALAYLCGAILLLCISKFKCVADLFRREDAVAEGLSDLGFNQAMFDVAVPAFMIFAPSTLLILFIAGF